jgi:uncharacterized membrane protein SirB2
MTCISHIEYMKAKFIVINANSVLRDASKIAYISLSSYSMSIEIQDVNHMMLTNYFWALCLLTCAIKIVLTKLLRVR